MTIDIPKEKEQILYILVENLDNYKQLNVLKY